MHPSPCSHSSGQNFWRKKSLQNPKQTPGGWGGGWCCRAAGGWGTGNLGDVPGVPCLWQLLVFTGFIWAQAGLAAWAGLIVTPGESEMFITAVLNGKFPSDPRWWFLITFGFFFFPLYWIDRMENWCANHTFYPVSEQTAESTWSQSWCIEFAQTLILCCLVWLETISNKFKAVKL